MAITNATRLADFGTGIGTDGAVLKVDNTNDRVGLGTTNPQNTVTVGAVGASGTSLFVHGDGRVTGVLTAGNFSGNLTGAVTSSGALSVTDTTSSTSTTTGALKVSGGIGVAKSIFVGEGISIAGTITYNDVTNIDSIGFVTAGKGLRATTGGLIVTAGVSTFVGDIGGKDGVQGLNVATALKVAGVSTFVGLVTCADIVSSGIITADSYYGDASNMTNAGATLSGSTDNTVVTVTGSNAMQGEANLKYDGTNLTLTTDADGEGIVVSNSGNTYNQFTFDADRSAATNPVGAIFAKWDGNTIGSVQWNAGRDTTNKDDGAFDLRTAAGGTNKERIRVGQDGKVLINSSGSDTGTAGGNYWVVIKTDNEDTWDGLSISGMKSGYNAIQCMPGADATYYPMYIRQHDDTYSGKISCYTNNTVSYDNASDYRLKQNDVAITDGIEKVKLLRPIRFEMKCDPGNQLEGFFAHEVQAAVPLSCAANGTKDQVDSDNNPVYQGMDYSKITPILTAALKEAIAKIETLETKVAALEAG